MWSNIIIAISNHTTLSGQYDQKSASNSVHLPFTFYLFFLSAVVILIFYFGFEYKSFLAEI